MQYSTKSLAIYSLQKLYNYGKIFHRNNEREIFMPKFFISSNQIKDNNIEIKEKNIGENLTINPNKEVVLNNVSESLNTYVTYHIHVLSDGEDIDTIINKYKVSKEVIDEYNQGLEWVMGEKVIIPELQDE